jgi:hypothetical protein
MIYKFLDYQEENDGKCIDLDTEKIGRGSQLCHVNCENEIELESCAFSNQRVLGLKISVLIDKIIKSTTSTNVSLCLLPTVFSWVLRE